MSGVLAAVVATVSAATQFFIQYLVIAGGGGGGAGDGGGGGAGGYRTNVPGQTSGGNSTAESPFQVELATAYTVTIGNGGSGGNSAAGANGQNSVFSTITSIGGGGGGAGDGAGGQVGGSGGGGGYSNSGGAGTTGQGFAGGAGANVDPVYPGGGGGGAGGAGTTASTSAGGPGLFSNITGTSVQRAGGGGGGREAGGNSAGGAGGGGFGFSGNGPAVPGGAGAVNTGSGGGGNGWSFYDNRPAVGGSGIVILRYPINYAISPSAGLTISVTPVGSDKVATITAGTGNVSFANNTTLFSALDGSTSTGLIGQFFPGVAYRSSLPNGNVGGLPLTSPTTYSSISYINQGDLYGFLAIGYFKPPTTGTYTFFTSSDDSSGVWIGDLASATNGRTAANAVVNNGLGGPGQGDTKRSGTISLTAGVWYPIRIAHEEGGGGDNLTFSWSGPGISETTSLSDYFKRPVNLEGTPIQTFY